MPTPSEIRTAREALGESQKTFGDRFGVDQSTVHRWETDGPPNRGAAKMAIERILDDLRSPSVAASEPERAAS